MELNLTATNYTAEWADAEDSEIHDRPPEIRFRGRCGSRTLDIISEAGARASEWADLATACEYGVQQKLDWGSGNGEMSIEVRGAEGLVFFTVARYSDGGGGKMECAVETSCCIDAFHHAAKLTEDWLDSHEGGRPLGPAGLDARIPQSWCGTETP